MELTQFLLDHGFNVESVMVDNFTESEDVFQKLRNTKPTLRIYETYGWNIRQMQRVHAGKILCIGQKSAYFMDSDYFVKRGGKRGNVWLPGPPPADGSDFRRLPEPEADAGPGSSKRMGV